MLPLLILFSLPYFLRGALKTATGVDFLGAGPVQAAPAPAAPIPLMMTPAGMAAGYATSPDGRKNLMRGVSLLKSAKKGNPKSKKRIRETKAKARAGDPKAKKELALLQTSAEALDEVEPEDEYEEDEE